ncbi:MAG: septum formation initiator family protein [Prevotella sp.]|jgi:cell division protein FtsB|nr:septum formation initiator family protein [Prevotella sp.]MBQ5495753.1 septum formation initiator family protein [Prevotella sp.]MBQ5547721.1 septum formation initiator family protein [Prevotella sp.]
MKKLKRLLVRIYHVKALKYALVTLVAVILIGFVDENSVWHHFQNKQKISELQDEIKQYLDEHERNKEQIEKLESNPKAIEKIARERYFMKADDEDIFVLGDDQKTLTSNETAE